MSTPLAAFGPGIAIITRTDVTPNIPVNVGFVNELSLDFAGTTKQLFGQNQFPLVAARGTIKATGKWKAAVLSGSAWNNVFYGMSSISTSSAFNLNWNVGSTFTLSTASTAAVQVGSTTTFDADLGVTYAFGAMSGLPLLRVTTGLESSGKYSVTNTSTAGPGSYNFSAADTTGGVNIAGGGGIKITYTNFVASGSGQALIVTNQLIGTSPTFQLDYYTTLSQPTAKAFVVRIYSCLASKHVIAAKLEDFIMPEFDFDIFATNAGNVIDYVFPEIS